jgi:single-stranded-DNA-specific exonuclease
MKRWIVKGSDGADCNDLAESLEISPVIARLLINRGFRDADQARIFLTGGVSDLYDPFLMKGMRRAVERLARAVKNKEKILIHGDYDVDGVTATALLIFVLRDFGLTPFYYIPDRLNEGYGLSAEGVKEALRIKAGLVITVDCGITSCEEIKALNAGGIDVIITDHHEVPECLPSAYSVINPHQKDCPYPDENLSGVGVAFKLCQALCSELGSKSVSEKLDIVAVGTISDVVPLVGENRILVKEGLKLLNNGKANKGIKALMEESGSKKKEIGSFEVGFIIGPRINAAGRLGSADQAVELLLTEDPEKAAAFAGRLNEANRERQKIERATLNEAVSKIDKEINFKEHKVIVLHNDDWHRGVIGIVASRISNRFYRPTLLISTKDGVGRGSGRSIENFHLFEALAGCDEILKEYGGHKYACGFTIIENNLNLFKKTINEIADNVLSAEDLIPCLNIDMEVKLNLLDYDVIRDISKIGPFGSENAEPLFCSRNLRLIRPPRIMKEEHLKLWVTDGSKNFEAVGFGIAKDPDIQNILNNHSEFDLAYTASINTWQGLDSIQLKIEDIKPVLSS